MKSKFWYLGWLVALLILVGSTYARAQDQGPAAELSVRLPDGSVYQFDCALSTDLLTPTPEMVSSTPSPTLVPSPTPTNTPIPRCYGVVNVPALNVRSGPGTNYSKVAAGSPLKIMARVDIISATVNASGETWYKISNPAGYVLATYITIPDDATCNLAAEI